MSVQNDRLTGLVGNSAIKVPCRAATTAAIVLSGLQTVDGVVLAADDRVLVKNQASSVDNGIYTVVTGGAWTRTKDCDGTYDLVLGSIVEITNGTVSAGLFYQCTAANPITIGTTALTWAVVSPSSPITLPLSLAQGGTAASSAISALSNLGVIQVTGEAGTANAQTGTIDALVTSLRADQLFLHVPSITNTGPTTITYTPSGGAALAAKNVFSGGAALVGGELVLGVPTILHYDGVQLNIIGRVPVVDTSPLVVGSADATKKLRIEVDGLTTATTRVWTAADLNIALGKQPTRQVFTSGSGATYTTPAGATRINVRMVGGGGGGGAQNTNNGANGTDTTFSTLTAAKGLGGSAAGAAPGAGGASTNGDINLSGATGSQGFGNTAGTVTPAGGAGANSAFGGGGAAIVGAAGGAAIANTGGGGGGGGGNAGTAAGSGGGAGGYCEKLIIAPSSTYTYTVGTGGNGGAAGGQAGGNGAAGIIIVDEWYN